MIRNFFPPEKCKEIYAKGDAYIIHILEKLEVTKHQKFLSNYDIICAEYDNNIYNKNRCRRSDFNGCKERQICVKNLSAITNISIMDLNTMNLQNIFDIVKENRSDLYD